MSFITAADTVSLYALCLAAALHFLAYAHSSGAHVFGLQHNDTKAVALELQAAKLGYPDAVVAMGFRHLHGLGVDKVSFSLHNTTCDV
jgi:TPR repeat protein